MRKMRCWLIRSHRNVRWIETKKEFMKWIESRRSDYTITSGHFVPDKKKARKK